MVTKAQQAKAEEAAAQEPAAVDPESAEGKIGHISNWEFLNRPPTSDEVLTLLRTLKPVHGLEHVDYADFVQALPAKKKIKKQHPTNPNLQLDEYIENWVLYMSVAGRQAMLNDAAAKNSWKVEVEPEPNSPVGAPGFLSMEQRIIYREYIKIWQRIPQNVEGVLHPDGSAVYPPAELYLGSRPGQAWVPFTGGSQAAGSNPYEKVETAARGRALGAWGFGVFPGSGIASLEEMQGVSENRQAMEREQPQQRGSGPAENTNRPSRERLMEDALTTIERLRQATNDTDEGMTAKVGQYLSLKLGLKAAYDPERRELHWDAVKDGQLMMMTRALQQKIADISGDL